MINANFIDKANTGTNTAWLLDKLDFCLPLPGVLASGNGTNFYGKIPGGTVLGKATSGGKFHPIGRALLTAITSSGNIVTVGAAAAKHFLVGDVVNVIDDEDADIVTSRTITAINSTTGAITVNGGTFSAAIGDRVQRADGTQTPYGLLALQNQNSNIGIMDEDGDPVRLEKGISVLIRGCIISASHPNLNTLDIADFKALGCGFRFV